MGKARGAPGARGRKMLALVCINASNMACHSVYSVLASFFPQAAHAKGLTAEPIGLVFAIFAAVVFVSAPLAAPMLSQHGKRQIYVAGLATVSSATIAFAFADHIDNPTAYLWWCILLRCVQGFGSALEETAAYALIAEIDPEAVSFNLGVTEISTGLGYMIGPTVGGFLFSVGGFALPFVAIGVALLPAILLILWIVPDDRLTGRQQAAAREELAASTPMRHLLARPQIFAIALTAILGNSDYAFLEPTLAGHVESIATSSTAVGMLFSVTSLTYTLAAPLMGWLSHKDKMGPRNVIILGIALQAAGFLLIGPSPLLPLAHRAEEAMSLSVLCGALFLFGLGEAMSMTPLMEDMMLSCVDRKDDAINALSALMTSCFSLGQMIGPLIGSFMAARLGFRWASTLLALGLMLHACVLVYLQRLSKPHQAGSMLAALTGQLPHSPVGADELSALNAHGDDIRVAHGDIDHDDDGGSSDAARLQRKWQS